jgi:hypothetical protein
MPAPLAPAATLWERRVRRDQHRKAQQARRLVALHAALLQQPAAALIKTILSETAMCWTDRHLARTGAPD